MINCYQVLGVKNFASSDEIKTAYRKLSKKFHPDVNEGDKFFEERFKEIQNAYEILTDSKEKEIHDIKLRSTFSNSNEYRFRTESSTKTDEPPKEDKKENSNQKDAYSSDQKKDSNPTSANDQSTLKKKKASSTVYFIALLIVAAVVIVIISNGNKSEQNSYSDRTSDYSNSQQKYSDYYPTNTTQYPNSQSSMTEENSNQDLSNDVQTYQRLPSNGDYFSIGSSQDQVLRVQGDPTGVNKFESMGEEIWTYGYSRVTFRNGIVSEYSNIGRNLKVKMATAEADGNYLSYFSIGSTKDEVLKVQGDPTGINKFESMGEEIWTYGYSRITFKNGRVSEFSNIGRNLKIEMEPSEINTNTSDYFSIGSTQDDVLKIQGNPTGINKFESMGEEIWTYGYSRITFKNGRVSEYSNIGKNLRIRL